MKTAFVITALAASTALANPVISKRWVCGGDAPAYSCQPSAGCKSEIRWADCAINDVLLKCGDPTPNHSTPVSACQAAGFTACEAKFC
ncbi:hypothetical protein B0J11DRAFT_581747 [Dendryphion nanum]|uniref:Uncharacterized protein n=1 Tax=Dendryphion nanum TaxID=256645 RepID=A0A9P9DKS5_9PLEO|nr:hypothetical protein B0J11DRAFT_581747 [Dendryphion nanum]